MLCNDQTPNTTVVVVVYQDEMHNLLLAEEMQN